MLVVMKAAFSCRSCGNTDLKDILSLGKTPLANRLLTPDQLNEPEPTYPLDLVFCPQCTLVQITETVPPDVLFRDYRYLSSVSDTVLLNARTLAERMVVGRHLGASHTVAEIASNDGYLLKNYKQHGIKVIGIEPARNIAKTARDAGIDTVEEFFDEKLAAQLAAQGNSADVIHANNVVAHVADLHGVVAGIATLLKPDGVAIIENHYVKDLIDHAEFDSIYHEHLCYYSATSFKNLFALHGLALGPMSMAMEGSPRVELLLEEERRWGVAEYSFYDDFGKKVSSLKEKLLSELKAIKTAGKHIAVYGASAKSATLLNYFGIGPETIDFVVDKSPEKQGRFAPGTHLPIYAPAKLLETHPEYTLLLSWNYADEVLKQQETYRKGGGRFIIPIPEFRIV